MQAPALIDTDKWELVLADEQKAVFTKSTVLENWSGSKFTCRLDRSVTLLDNQDVNDLLNIELPEGVNSIVFISENKLTNTGNFEWNKSTGMLSIWILGQFIPSDKNTVIIPYKQSDSDQINDSYFGKIDADRLKVTDKHLFF